MAESDWKIAKSSECCTLCSAKFPPGQVYFSALVEKEGAFERRDYCSGCFREHRSEDVYSFWQTRVPDEEEGLERRPVLDPESVLEFFRRLGQERDEQKRAFRFVLALMLTRKKVLKLDGTARSESGEELLVFVERRGGERHEVPALQMDEGALKAAGEELGRLLGLAPAETASPVSQQDEQSGS